MNAEKTYAVRLYDGKNNTPTVIQYYKRRGAAEKRAKDAVVFRGYSGADIVLNGSMIISYRLVEVNRWPQLVEHYW